MKHIFTLFLLLVAVSITQAQDDLLKELEQDDKDETTVIGTFNGTRIINGHSVETKHKGSLEFIITHRFGRINKGGYEMWGLDESVIRLGLEYGITDRLGVGVGRSSGDKSFDYYVKYKALEQKPGVPVTVSILGTMAYKASLNREAPDFSTGDKIAYVGELLIARKFSSRLSLQLMPILVHQNRVLDENIWTKDLISLGFGGRMKLTKSMAILSEYYLRLNEKDNDLFDSFGMGVEFETGGHVFQLVFTNSYGMIERSFLTETYDDFFNGDIHFGFNITRTFQLAGKK
jgi:hypothetical protein